MHECEMRGTGFNDHDSNQQVKLLQYEISSELETTAVTGISCSSSQGNAGPGSGPYMEGNNTRRRGYADGGFRTQE